jgi:hypothetical protein
MNVDLILQPHFSAAGVAWLGALAESYGSDGVTWRPGISFRERL